MRVRGSREGERRERRRGRRAVVRFFTPAGVKSTPGGVKLTPGGMKSYNFRKFRVNFAQVTILDRPKNRAENNFPNKENLSCSEKLVQNPSRRG